LSYEINSEQILVRDGIGSVVGFPWSVVRSMTETNSGFSITLRPAGARRLAKPALSSDAPSSRFEDSPERSSDWLLI
jgi:hypothetical protein